MARYTGPKNRVARRFGANIFGKQRNPLLHKPNPPGMHGAVRKKKSDFGAQLEEQQKLKAIYGMLSQKCLVKYYREAVRREQNTSHLLLQLLETRLDSVIYRMRLAQTIFHAQQLISHGHIQVDGKKVDIRSYHVAPGQVISVKEKSRSNPIILRALENKHRELPEYVEFDDKKMAGQLITMPEYDQISMPLPINVPLVCEFLAHSC